MLRNAGSPTNWTPAQQKNVSARQRLNGAPAGVSLGRRNGTISLDDRVGRWTAGRPPRLRPLPRRTRTPLFPRAPLSPALPAVGHTEGHVVVPLESNGYPRGDVRPTRCTARCNARIRNGVRSGSETPRPRDSSAYPGSLYDCNGASRPPRVGQAGAAPPSTGHSSLKWKASSCISNGFCRIMSVFCSSPFSMRYGAGCAEM